MEKILLALSEFRAEVKSLFSGAKNSAEKSAADEKIIADLRAQLAESQEKLKTAESSAKDLAGKLAVAESNAKDLQAKLEAETKRVDETLSAMGVDPKNIPAQPKQGPKAVKGQALVDEWAALKGAEKTTFYRKNASEIDKAFAEGAVVPPPKKS